MTLEAGKLYKKIGTSFVEVTEAVYTAPAVSDALELNPSVPNTIAATYIANLETNSLSVSNNTGTGPKVEILKDGAVGLRVNDGTNDVLRAYVAASGDFGAGDVVIGNMNIKSPQSEVGIAYTYMQGTPYLKMGGNVIGAPGEISNLKREQVITLPTGKLYTQVFNLAKSNYVFTFNHSRSSIAVYNFTDKTVLLYADVYGTNSYTLVATSTPHAGNALNDISLGGARGDMFVGRDSVTNELIMGDFFVRCGGSNIQYDTEVSFIPTCTIAGGSIYGASTGACVLDSYVKNVSNIPYSAVVIGNKSADSPWYLKYVDSSGNVLQTYTLDGVTSIQNEIILPPLYKNSYYDDSYTGYEHIVGIRTAADNIRLYSIKTGEYTAAPTQPEVRYFGQIYGVGDPYDRANKSRTVISCGLGSCRLEKGSDVIHGLWTVTASIAGIGPMSINRVSSMAVASCSSTDRFDGIAIDNTRIGVLIGTSIVIITFNYSFYPSSM